MNISKTKYMKGLQCPKLLWTACNDSDSIPEPDAGTSAIFNEGTAVGELARSLFPGGTLVAREEGFGNMIGTTKRLLPERKPIFEATFAAGGIYAQADILNPTEDARWDIIEVKMTTCVKPPHIQDLAVQRHCYECAGLPLRNCRLMHINKQYVRKGELEPEKLFTIEDVTELVIAETPGIEDRISEMHRIVGLPECPSVEMGDHCCKPYACPLITICRQNSQGEAVLAADEGEIQYDAERLGDYLNQLVFPLYLLDFETFSKPIPPFDGSWPYMQTPFQFSLHVAESLDAEPAHHSWIWDGTGDPRPLMLGRLRELIGENGSILAYFYSFEKGRLQQSASAFPEYAEWVGSLMPRMVDLIVPFKSRIVSHPAQDGSNSLKAVYPAIAGTGYNDLDIQDGGTASAEFLRCLYGNPGEEERARIFRNLEEYCGRDTIAMLHILRKLAELQ